MPVDLPPNQAIEQKAELSEERLEEIARGAKIAKAGFQTEKDVAAVFGNFKTSKLAQAWLKSMKFEIALIEGVSAEVVPGSRKADLKIVVSSKVRKAKEGDSGAHRLAVQYFQLKLVSNPEGFNQIDKRWLKSYQDQWKIPADTYKLLQHFCGELPPYKEGTKDKRRMFFSEFTTGEQKKVLSFFSENKNRIIEDLFKGAKIPSEKEGGQFKKDTGEPGLDSPQWFMVIQKLQQLKEFPKPEGDGKDVSDKSAELQSVRWNWAIRPMDEVIKFYSKGEVKISPRGSLHLGKVRMQRKGGDNGRPTANMLQFKINPAELIDPVVP